MDQFLNNIWSENNYPAKTRLLKLAKEANPDVKPKDIDTFLNDQISYQLLKETKNLTSHLGHIVAFRINETWQIDIMMLVDLNHRTKSLNICLLLLMSFLVLLTLFPKKLRHRKHHKNTRRSY